MFLLACPKHVETPSVLGWTYHTSIVPPGTASRRREQVYPQSRSFWRQCVTLPNLMELAARSLVGRLRLPHPGSVDNRLDTTVWSTSVLPQVAVPVAVPQPVGVPQESDDARADFDAEFGCDATRCDTRASSTRHISRHPFRSKRLTAWPSEDDMWLFCPSRGLCW